ncbi:unnamed protein product [Trichobilharzia regenti]|nr:unnamed protein product [Trichobilharzia regenti]
MIASGTGTGGSSTPDSNEFVRGTSPEFTDELGELVPVLDSIHLVPYKSNIITKVCYKSTPHCLQCIPKQIDNNKINL